MNRALPSVEPPRAIEPAAAVVVAGLGDELLTVNDAARVLRVTVSWVYEHTRDDAEDRLPFVKIGKYVRFDRTDLSASSSTRSARPRAAHQGDVDDGPPARYREPQKARRATP